MSEIPPHTLPEWSYLVEEDRAGTDITDVTISPSPEESDALCHRLNLSRLDNLQARMTLARVSGGMVVHVKGRFTGHVVQACVVSLEPVETDLDEEFEGWFANTDQAIMLAKARRERKAKNGEGETPILDEKDDPEPIVNGHIDLAELVTQYLSLAIEPYPRAPGREGDEENASDSQGGEASEASDISRNPFAALKNWKSGQDGE